MLLVSSSHEVFTALQLGLINMSIVFVGEAYGEQEAKLKTALVGPTGIELLKILDEAQIITLTAEDWSFISKFWEHYDPVYVQMIWNMHPELLKTNVFNKRPPGNKVDWFCGGKDTAIAGYPYLVKGKYVRAEFQSELDRLAEELCAWNPNLIIAMGNTALWALCGKTTISRNRGTTSLSTHTVSGFKILPTYHPAAIFQQWKLRPTTVIDFMKARREMSYPEIRRPPREVWIEPTLEDLHAFKTAYIDGCPILSVDIETSGNQITCIGFSPRRDIAIVIPFHDSRKAGRAYWPTVGDERAAWLFVQSILASPIRKLFQNGTYDIAFLWRAYGMKVYGAEHDTLLLHHALQPESLKGLGFLGSIYTNEGSWKQMRHTETTIKKDD